MYQLRTCKQKTTNVTPFQSNFDRKPNTPPRLGCIKFASTNNKFTVKVYLYKFLKSIMYQLRTCKQKTTNVTPFQSNFDRKPNTPPRLGCIKFASTNNKFTVKVYLCKFLKSIMYQLRTCKQKTTNVTPFQANFGRKPNTPLNNIIRVTKSSKLKTYQVLNHYLEADTVPFEDMNRAQVDKGGTFNGDKNKSLSRFIIQPKK